MPRYGEDQAAREEQKQEQAQEQEREVVASISSNPGDRRVSCHRLRVFKNVRTMILRVADNINSQDNDGVSRSKVQDKDSLIRARYDNIKTEDNFTRMHALKQKNVKRFAPTKPFPRKIIPELYNYDKDLPLHVGNFKNLAEEEIAVGSFENLPRASSQPRVDDIAMSTIPETNYIRK